MNKLYQKLNVKYFNKIVNILNKIHIYRFFQKIYNAIEIYRRFVFI